MNWSIIHFTFAIKWKSIIADATSSFSAVVTYIRYDYIIRNRLLQLTLIQSKQKCTSEWFVEPCL